MMPPEFRWLADVWAEVKSNWRTAFWVVAIVAATGVRVLTDLSDGDVYAAVMDVILSFGTFVVGATSGYLAGIRWTRQIYHDELGGPPPPN